MHIKGGISNTDAPTRWPNVAINLVGVNSRCGNEQCQESTVDFTSAGKIKGKKSIGDGLLFINGVLLKKEARLLTVLPMRIIAGSSTTTDADPSNANDDSSLPQIIVLLRDSKTHKRNQALSRHHNHMHCHKVKMRGRQRMKSS